MSEVKTTDMRAFLQRLDAFLSDKGFCPSRVTNHQDGHWLRHAIASLLQSPCALNGACQETSIRNLLRHMRHIKGWDYDHAFRATVTLGGFPETWIPRQ
jgi:hypothetical protein